MANKFSKRMVLAIYVLIIIGFEEIVRIGEGVLKLDICDFKKTLNLIPILLAVLLLAHALPADAALLCSYSGPDSADDYLELSDFEVTRPEPLMVGDTMTVSFTLKSTLNFGEFGEQGAFVAARGPDGIDRSFGHAYQNYQLPEGESISVQASTTVDKEGDWIFWTSYHIIENSPNYYGEHFAPDEWHACYLTARIQPDLTVEKIFWNPTLPEIGEPVTVAVVVRNIGAPSSEWVYLMLWGCCDLSRQVRPLKSGEAATVYFEPITFEEPGEFEITATIDTAGKIAESNEANNERSEVITVEGILPPLSISIFTDPVPSGESNEVAVLVTANGDPVHDAFISLSAPIGDLEPDAGTTDADGGFVSIFTAPAVRVETMYTINAEAEIGDRAGEGSVSDLITVPRELPPTAHMEIYPNPAYEGESVTLEGWGEDEDGEVAECRWTLPDGSIRSYSGGSSEFTLEPDEVQAGVYRFAVRDDRGIWSEEVGEELDVVVTEFPTEPVIPDILVAITALAVGALLVYYVLRKLVPEPNSGIDETKDNNEPEEDEDEEQHGSIHATSDPTDAMVFVDVEYKGRSPKTINNLLIGPHTVLFSKRGYFDCEKDAVVANQMTPVHCDLTKMPEVKLKLSADPAEIVADRESRSMVEIEIEIVTKDDNEIPIPVPKDTTVILETDLGTIENPVKIPRGRASVMSILIFPTSSGIATVKAEAECRGMMKLKGSTTVEFLDAESE